MKAILQGLLGLKFPCIIPLSAQKKKKRLKVQFTWEKCWEWYGSVKSPLHKSRKERDCLEIGSSFSGMFLRCIVLHKLNMSHECLIIVKENQCLVGMLKGVFLIRCKKPSIHFLRCRIMHKVGHQTSYKMCRWERVQKSSRGRIRCQQI